MPTRINVANSLLRDHGVYETVAVMVFTVGDVVDRAKDIGKEITEEEAVLILEQVHQDQSSEQGINWAVIDQAIIDSQFNHQIVLQNG